MTTTHHLSTHHPHHYIKESLKCSSEPSLSSPTSTTASAVDLDSNDDQANTSCDSSANSSPSKLAVLNSDNCTEQEELPKKLTRGISRATDNVNLVSRARTEFAADFRTLSSSRESKLLISPNGLGLETPDYTFVLPDLSIHPDDFRTFLERDLIEKSTLISLEHCGRLNWWSDIGACQRLWPLATSGDGNCLLHAASLGMWGFHDRFLTLRKALHAVLTSSSYSNSFYRRWRWQTTLTNKEAGLVYCEEEWEREWKELLKMASTEPRLRAHQDSSTSTTKSVSGGKKEGNPEDEMAPHVYESLEEIHILALAHVLKRPIIVIADTMLKDVTGEPFAPIPFGGIYLPVECPVKECHRSPLCLTYDAAHFSALVAMDKETYADKVPHPPATIPLVDPEHKLLNLQFVVDPGPEVRWGHDEDDPAFIAKTQLSEWEKLSLLKDYLDLVHVYIPEKPGEEVKWEKPKYARSSFVWVDGEFTCTTPDPDVDCIEPTTDATKRTSKHNILGKSFTLPSSFEEDSRSSGSSSETQTCPSVASSMEPGTSATISSVGSTKESGDPRARSKTAKQIQSITRHFGSLGRSMSKRIKKNFNSLRRGASFRKPKLATCIQAPTNSTLEEQEQEQLSHSGNANSDEKPTLSSKQQNQPAPQHERKDPAKELNCEYLVPPNVIISAILHIEKRHEYHDDMIRNYLTSARTRFLASSKT